MSDPIRWKDGGGAPEGLSDLLRSAPRPRPMNVAERARTAARVATAAKTSAAASGAGWGAAWAKIGILTGVGAIGILAKLLWPSPIPASPSVPAVTAPVNDSAAPVDKPSPADNPSPVDSAAPADSASPSDSPSPTSAALDSAPRSAPASRPAPPKKGKDPLFEEAQSLERARAGLADDPSKSLAELRENEKRFPRGKLAAEREVLVIEALVRAGRRDEARARARQFLARFPESPFAPRVQQISSGPP